MEKAVATVEAVISGGNGTSTISFNALRSELATTFIGHLIDALERKRHVYRAYRVRQVVVVEHDQRIQPNGLAKQLRCAGRLAQLHVKTSVVKAKA